MAAAYNTPMTVSRTSSWKGDRRKGGPNPKKKSDWQTVNNGTGVQLQRPNMLKRKDKNRMMRNSAKPITTFSGQDTCILGNHGKDSYS